METATEATRDGAFLALALADALRLGLPDPDYITISVNLARSTTISAVSFQFNDRNGQEPLPRMIAWARRFGAAIRTETDDPAKTWHKFEFTHAGVLFDAYAAIEVPACGDVAGHTGVTCALPPGHDGRHSNGRHPAVVWGPGVTEPEPPAAALERSIREGTPLLVTDDDQDGGCLMPSPHNTSCTRPAGHDVIDGSVHRDSWGMEWDDDGTIDDPEVGDPAPAGVSPGATGGEWGPVLGAVLAP